MAGFFLSSVKVNDSKDVIICQNGAVCLLHLLFCEKSTITNFCLVSNTHSSVKKQPTKMMKGLYHYRLDLTVSNFFEFPAPQSQPNSTKTLQP